MSKSNPLDGGRCQIPCRRWWRCRTLWCMFQLLGRTWREWKCVFICAKVSTHAQLDIFFSDSFQIIWNFEWYNHLFKQCFEFSFARRCDKANNSYWSWHWYCSVSSILATLGLFEGTRSEYTGNCWHSNLTSQNSNYIVILVLWLLWKCFFLSWKYIFFLFDSCLKFGCFSVVELRRWIYMVMKSRNWSKRKF